MVQHSLSSMELALSCNQYTEVPCRLKLLPGSQHCELMFVACWFASQRQPCRHNIQFTCNKPCLGILFGGMSSYMAPLGQQTQLTRQWFIRYACPNPSTNGLCLHDADLCKVGKATCNTSMWVMGRKPHCSHKGAPCQVKLLHTPNCARELCTGMAVHTDWGVGGVWWGQPWHIQPENMACDPSLNLFLTSAWAAGCPQHRVRHSSHMGRPALSTCSAQPMPTSGIPAGPSSAQAHHLQQTPWSN